jgi:hypothetical protein
LELGSRVLPRSTGTGVNASRCVSELPILVLVDRRLSGHLSFIPFFTGYVVLLRSLVPKFPLTLRGLEYVLSAPPLTRILMPDMKSTVSAPLPYKRVSSPAHFRALIPGRRKAMEVSAQVCIVNVHSL